MASDTRKWNCPECGATVEISIFQLDPLACDACLAKRKGRKSGSVSASVSGEPTDGETSAAPAGSGAAPGPADPRRLLIVAGAILLAGLVVGFLLGRWTAPSGAPARGANARTSESPGPVDGSKPAGSRASSKGDDATEPDGSKTAGKPLDEEPDESTRPGPNYRWVKGYTRKDGVRVKGHWAKDSRK